MLKKKKRQKRSKKEFQRFEKLVYKYGKMLVPEYQIYVEMKPLYGAMAQAESDKAGAIATITLNLYKDSGKDIERAAFHEVIHILLNRMSENMSLYFSHTFVSEMEEEIIRKLENMVFGPKGGL